MIGATAAVVMALATTHCPARSIGPGSLHGGGTAGATCMLAAFRNDCHPAAYSLSSHGVDTIRTETFRMVRGNSGCSITVTESFRVVPQQPHVTARYVCRRLRPFVADRCTPTRTISLTKL